MIACTLGEEHAMPTDETEDATIYLAVVNAE
jgi:hypothetical protein